MDIDARELEKGNFVILDMRSEVDREFGSIPGSVYVDTNELLSDPPKDKDKRYVICCDHGILSRDIAERCGQWGMMPIILRTGITAI